MGAIWSAAHEYPKKSRDMMEEKQRVLDNTKSCNILFTVLRLQYIISNHSYDLPNVFRLALQFYKRTKNDKQGLCDNKHKRLYQVISSELKAILKLMQL
jgi:hypothetical protein